MDVILPPLSSSPTNLDATSISNIANTIANVLPEIKLSPPPSPKKKRARSDASGPVTTSVRRSTRQNPTNMETTCHTGSRWSTQSRKPKKDTCVPHWLDEYVQSVADPCPDGHCGNWAIAIALGRSEDQLLTVHKDLIAELRSKSEFYNLHFKARKRGDGDVADHITAIQTSRADVVDTPLLWLDLAQMLYIIATTYKTVFCVYSDYVSF